MIMLWTCRDFSTLRRVYSTSNRRHRIAELPFEIPSAKATWYVPLCVSLLGRFRVKSTYSAEGRGILQSERYAGSKWTISHNQNRAPFSDSRAYVGHLSGRCR